MILGRRYLRNHRLYIAMPATYPHPAEDPITLDQLKEEILRDYALVCLSRESSPTVRKRK